MLSESSGSRHLAAGSDRISAGNFLRISKSWSACCCWGWARGCWWCGEWGSCPERGSRAGSATRCPWWRADCFLQVSDLFSALCCGTSLSVLANLKRRMSDSWLGWRMESLTWSWSLADSPAAEEEISWICLYYFSEPWSWAEPGSRRWVGINRVTCAVCYP